MQVAPIAFRHHVDPEDQARADVYAVLARLYADAPGESFLDVGDLPPLPPGVEPGWSAW